MVINRISLSDRKEKLFMPTIEQLVRNGRKDKIAKSKSPALGVGFNSLEKKYTKLPAELMGDTDGLDMAGELQNSYSEDDLKNVKVSEVEIGGKKLILESYNSGGTTVNYYFDGDKLIRRDDVYADGTVSSTVFKRFTTNVPDSYFEVPDGYGYLNLSWLESLGAFE